MKRVCAAFVPLAMTTAAWGAAPASQPASSPTPKFWSAERGMLVDDTYWVVAPKTYPDPLAPKPQVRRTTSAPAPIYTISRGTRATNSGGGARLERGGSSGRGMEGGRGSRGSRSSRGGRGGGGFEGP